VEILILAQRCLIFVLKSIYQKMERRDNRRGNGASGQPRRTAPAVDRSERKQTEVGDIVQGGVAHFKVSAATPRNAYCHLSRLFLAGFDNAGHPLSGTNKVNSVQLTGLGSAITTVIYVADNLVKGGVATYGKVETEFLDGEDKDVSRRSGPRIVITVNKQPTWNYQADEQLKKSKIYRRNVLKEHVAGDDSD